MKSTFWTDGYRDGWDGEASSPPCFSVFCQEYTAGFSAGQEDRAESERTEFLLVNDLL